MLAIPITKNLSWRNAPVVTLVLIIVNVLVFTVIQRGDEERSNIAESYYFESGLDKLEFPLYENYLKGKAEQRGYRHSSDEHSAESQSQSYYTLNFDNGFLKILPQSIRAANDTDTYNRWRQLRAEHDRLYSTIVTIEYGFRPAALRLSTWLTSMFLHGDSGHLIGNMVFLWLVGAAIELGCRRWVFLCIYLAGGWFASGLFALFNLHSLVPAIGASGAISGLMGAFCVLYGRKKVKFFITLGFYFNYLKIPGLVMLPLWVGNEIVQMISNPGSPIAYTAHLGGLIGGAVLTRGLLLVPSLFKQAAFHDETSDPINGMVEEALHYMSELKFPQARALLVSALEKRPDDATILNHIFNIDRQTPTTNSSRLHKTASTLLNLLTRSESNYDQAHRIYTQYVSAVHTPKLPSALYARLSLIFSSLGQSSEARKLIAVLLRHRPNQPMLPTALLKLARAHARAGEFAAQRSCLELIRRQYPQSSEARLISNDDGELSIIQNADLSC
jgi:membrane associated rhomboid family serine protease/Tfp pilus assembly protein PilF